jgi:methylmalonyl-CoA mutase, N-terminal domain
MLTAQHRRQGLDGDADDVVVRLLGGTQSLHTNSRDEALGLPTEESVRIALRTQQIIANESGVADVIDPLGGSHLIEALTDEIEGKAEEYLRKIDEMGGMVQAISKGYVQREIQEAAYAWQRRVESKDQVVVGVNAYRSEDPAVPVLKVDPALEEQQAARLRAFRKERKERETAAAIDAVRAGAKGTQNLMPLIVAAVKANATLGEISDALRDVFGEYRETVVL